MFQRFHDAKTQDSDIIQENGSRSNTPGVAIDGRRMYTCNVSPMVTHDSLGSSYSTSISPSPSVISQNTQVVCEDKQVIHNSKYIATSPPEAHRYVVEVYRSSNDDTDSIKYIDDSGRMSIDDFRESQVDQLRVPIEMQRIHLDEQQTTESYRRTIDSYHPVDLQRVPEYALEEVGADQQRLESEISRLHSELVRSSGDQHILQENEIDLNAFQNQNTHTLDYRIVTEDCRESSPRMIQESPRGNISDPQRLLQESILKDYYTSSQRHPELIRISSAPRMTSENIRYASPENIRAHRFDMDINQQSSILTENLRLGAETPHSIVSDNLRVTPDGSNMVPENLCITDPQHVMAENLHISSDVNINGLSPDASGDSHIVAHTIAADPPMTARDHYISHLNNDPSHSYREAIRVQSPQYTDNYRSNIYNGNIPTAPPTPAPSVPPLSETTSTPISGRYYSGDSYISTTPHSSHSIVYSNQFNTYSNEIPDDKDFRQTVLSVEERIERGYQDIKPFDQNYPASLPVMHITQEALPLPSIPKLPKPKKPKEAKPLRTPIIHKCVECERNFKNSTQLKNHMWRHTGEKPFTCEECGSKFTQQGNLRAHRRIHTGERPYQCSDCKSCFTQLSTLKTHQKIHSNERPYKCNHCEAAFRQIANLKTHQVTHTGERPHQCDLCDKAFTQKSNLKAHKNRVHRSDGTNGAPHRRGRRKTPAAIRPYSCLECAAQFTIMSNLKSHMKLHSGERCFECDFCGAGFTQRSNLKTHMQRMHGRGIGQGRRRIRCDECPAMFRLKRCLKTHKKKRHPLQNLKIKFRRDSNYSAESVGHSDELSDEFGSDDDTLDGDYSDTEETKLDSNVREDFKRKSGGPDDKKTVYDPSLCCKVEPELESHFEYPGSPVAENTSNIIMLPEVKRENGIIDNKDIQKTLC